MERNIFSLLILTLFLQLFSFNINAKFITNDNTKKIKIHTIQKNDIFVKSKYKEVNTRKDKIINTNTTFKTLKNSNISKNKNNKFMGIVGCISMLAIAFLLSNNRKKISIKLVISGLTLQFAFAFIVLKLGIGNNFFNKANDAILKILQFANEGARFLFGNLVSANVPVGIISNIDGSFTQINNAQFYANTGAFFAFNVLPTIIFFSALTAVLYHLRILEYAVRFMAFFMQKTLKTSGAESFSAAANIFVGQTEAPLLIRPFLKKMTDSEIIAIMTGGFATVAGGIMAAYVAILSNYFPDIAGHLLAASVMAAPASLVMAKIIIPETKKPETALASDVILKKNESNLIDAAAKGTSDGLYLALNVGAMLISFIALIAFLNWIISTCGYLFGFENCLLENIFGYIFAPIAFLLGVPNSDAMAIGSLFGIKIAVNELVAYIQLANDLDAGVIKNSKSIIIATYALCGFANFSSIGIQIGGLSALAPERRHDFARLGLKAMIAGSLACFQTAAIAGMLI